MAAGRRSRWFPRVRTRICFCLSWRALIPWRRATLRGRVLYLARADAKLPQGRFFVQELLGLSAVDADTGHVYGTVTDVFPTGSTDVYQVTDEHGRDYLVPAIREVIVRVDVDGGVLELRPMRGIFDDAD